MTDLAQAIPVESRRNIKQDTQSDYLARVEHEGTMADCPDNDNYLLVIDDTGTSCNSSKAFATEQASKSLTLAGNDNEDYLVVTGESSSNAVAVAYPTDDYLIPVDNSKEPSNSVQPEYLVVAADATCQGYVNVVDDSKYYRGSTFTSEAHEQQQEQATRQDHDNKTVALDLSTYDNTAQLNAKTNEVSMLVTKIFRSFVQLNLKQRN